MTEQPVQSRRVNLPRVGGCEECGAPILARRLCSRHYQARWKQRNQANVKRGNEARRLKHVPAAPQIYRCDECGARFEGYRYRFEPKYCSPECVHKADYRREQEKARRDPDFREQLAARTARKRATRAARLAAGAATDDDVERALSAATHCAMCGVPVIDDPDRDQSKELDHIVPLAIGGRHDPENLRVLCAHCNRHRPRDGSDLTGGGGSAS